MCLLLDNIDVDQQEIGSCQLNNVTFIGLINAQIKSQKHSQDNDDV